MFALRDLSSSSLLVVSLFVVLVLSSVCHAHGDHYQNNSLYAGTDYEDSDAEPSSNRDPNVIFIPRLGEIRGTIVAENIKAFLGLQYGLIQPGLGRFQKATPFRGDNNSGIIDATTEPKACPQFPNLQEALDDESRGVEFSNCLYVNVYVPNKSGTFPVMVYVHGEMLFDGSAEEAKPDYLLQHNVILVSVSYRLAPFGFLTTLTDELPGNVALADLQMALEWVHQHIQYFGGTQNHVALFGQAGGATLVHALSLSGKAQGLFHNVILQSGTALNPYFLDEDPLSTARNLARLARCPFKGAMTQSLIRCFERIRTSDLLTAFKRHWQENESRGLLFTGGFKLVVGDKLGYLTKHPAALVTENKYPLIAGVTKDAAAFIMSRFYNQLLQVRSRNISDYINIVLRHTTHPRFHLIWKHWALQHIFSEQETNNVTLPNLAQGLLELANMILYRGPLLDSIRYTSRQYLTFLYCFDYRGEFHRFGHLRNPLPFEADATLSDDNIYLFPYPQEVARLNAKDKIIVRLLTRMWFTFAGHNVPDFDHIAWPRVNSEYGPFVRIGNERPGHLELDYHFGEGIPVPNLYPEYFKNFTTTTTTTTTTTPHPPYHTYPVNATSAGDKTEGDIIARYVHNPLDYYERKYQTNNQHT